MALADDLSTDLATDRTGVEPPTCCRDIDVRPVAERRAAATSSTSRRTGTSSTRSAASRWPPRSGPPSGRIDRPDLVPLTAHAMYCAPIQAGAVEIDVDVLRNGRTAAQASVDLRQQGHTASTSGSSPPSASASTRRSSTRASSSPTTSCRPRPLAGRPSIDEIADGRGQPVRPRQLPPADRLAPGARGLGLDRPAGPSPASAARRRGSACCNEPRLPDGRIDPVSLCVPADSVGNAVGRAVGQPARRQQPFLILSLEIDLQFFADTTSSWLLQNVTAQHAGDSYAYGTTEIWDIDRRLIAIATQRARLRPIAAGEAVGPRQRPRTRLTPCLGRAMRCPAGRSSTVLVDLPGWAAVDGRGSALEELDHVAVGVLGEADDGVAELGDGRRLAGDLEALGADGVGGGLRIGDVEDDLDRQVLVVPLGAVGPVHQHDAPSRGGPRSRRSSRPCTGA